MKIGILGVTGVVGETMLKCLNEQNIRVDELRLFASKKSVGKEILFNGKVYYVSEAVDGSFDGLDVVLAAIDENASRYYAPLVVKANAVYIDNSSAFRYENDVPLIIPEINGKQALNHKGIIANPNCSTIISLMAIYGINKLSPITNLIASTYQAVSGAGINGIYELDEQIKDISENKEVKSNVFEKQIAYNCLAKIGSFINDDTSEELKLLNESKKILNLPDIKVSCTCVRVPVYRSHSISISFKTKDKLDLETVKKAIRLSSGVKLYVDDYPTPLDSSDLDVIKVGRVRENSAIDGFSLWCCGDQIRKGAASNAVSIIKCLSIE